MHKAIVCCEVPALEILFSPTKIHVRHSVIDAEDFNTFVSDIDISAVGTNEQDLQRAFLRHSQLKCQILNLGEIELYLADEWALKLKLMSSPLYGIWRKLYLLRKLRWQEACLREAKNEYQVLKHQRGIQVTLKRLGAEDQQIDADELFGFHMETTGILSLPNRFHSMFLDSAVGLKGSADRIVLASPAALETFRRFLPDTPEPPIGDRNREIKLFILLCEYLQTHITRRHHVLLGRRDQIAVMEHWMGSLRERGCPEFKDALRIDF